MRRDGVNATPTRSLRIIPASCFGKLAGDGRVETEAAVIPADQHRDQRARERREPLPPCGRGRGEAGLGHPVERRSRDQDVGTGKLVMTVDHDKIEAGSGHTRMLHLHHRGAAPAQRRADCRRDPAAADDHVRERRRKLPPDGGQRVRPKRGSEPPPGRAWGDSADHRGQPGSLGQPERLRLQAGIILAEDPGVGGISHRPRNAGRRFSL